jgi:hypothetical protein
VGDHRRAGEARGGHGGGGPQRAQGRRLARRQRPPRPSPIRYLASPRHALEVEHFSYRRELERIVAGLDRRLRVADRITAET